jgi:hypothetical protein
MGRECFDVFIVMIPILCYGFFSVIYAIFIPYHDVMVRKECYDVPEGTATGTEMTNGNGGIVIDLDRIQAQASSLDPLSHWISGFTNTKRRGFTVGFAIGAVDPLRPLRKGNLSKNRVFAAVKGPGRPLSAELAPVERGADRPILMIFQERFREMRTFLWKSGGIWVRIKMRP